MYFNSYPEYLKNLFGERVQKLSINAGFTCPNRDGNSGVGGCSFCNGLAFTPAYTNPQNTITQQLIDGINFHRTRNNKLSKFIAYFQSFSNTYAQISTLKQLFSEALTHPSVIGLVIATRPDCVDDEKLDYLQELSQKYYIKIEFGVESTYNNTLKRINRGHDFETTVTAFEKANARNLRTCAHLIFGLPYETPQMMIDEAAIISRLKPESIKFHQLQIMKNTVMTQDYLNNPELFHLFDLEEYINIIVQFTERLNPEISIERIASEVPKQFQMLPSKWNYAKYDTVLQKFTDKFKELNTYQGKYYQP